jgi:PST family polysaccharide transporter
VTDKTTSYRRILKTSSIIGGSSFINILIGLVRIKVLAVLLGPAGVGLVGLYTGLMSTAATVATMGVGTVGTRQIAEAAAKDDAHALAMVRRAMFWGTMLLALAGALTVWTLRDVLAVHVLGSMEHAGVVGWLSLGVALSVAGASQGALIQGMRRIGDMARLSVYGSVLSTAFGIALIWQWGSAALWAFVLIGPLVSFVLGHVFVSRLPKVATSKATVDEITAQWKVLLHLGVPFMGAGLAGTMVQLWIRVTVNNELGLDEVGHFQAAWTISMQYIGFVLGAMGADYYPRLTGVINDKVAATRLVNEQTEIALLLSTPIFIAMLGLAPWVIRLLYSEAFAPAVDILRWQILGDVLKVASWPLGFVILAAGAGKTFFWTETTTLLLMGGMIAGFAPSMGLQITGISFFAGYIYLTPLVYYLARRRIQFAWTASVIKLLAASFGLCVLVSILSSLTRWGTAVALVVSAIFFLYTVGRLSEMSNLGGHLGRIGAMARRVTTKIGLKHG